MIAIVTAPSFIQIKILLVRNDAKERLEKEHLQIIHVAAKDIQWTQKGKEITIGDRLFDVKEFSHDDNGYVLKGIYDDEEFALDIKLKDAWRQQHSNNTLILLKYFQFLGLGYSHEPFLKTAWPSESVKLYAKQIHFYNKQIFLKIPYPPPQQYNHLPII